MVASWLGLAVMTLVKALCSACIKAPAATFPPGLSHLFADVFLLRRVLRIAAIASIAVFVLALRGDTNESTDAWLPPLISQSAFSIPGTYLNLSPGRSAPSLSRDGDGQVVIDIPPDRGEVLYAIGFDRTLHSGEVVVEVGADRPMSIEAFIETNPADWRSRHSVVLHLHGAGMQTFIVPLSRFKQAYYTSGELLGVHFPESVRRSLVGLTAGTKAYAAGIVINGFPAVDTPNQILTEGKITLHAMAQQPGKVGFKEGVGQEWIEPSAGTDAFDVPGTFRWEDRKQAGVWIGATWSRDKDGNVVGSIAQGQGEVQYGRALDEELGGDTVVVEARSSVPQTLSVYLDPVPGNVTARRFAHIELDGGGLQKVTIPLSEFGLTKGTRVYQVGIRDLHQAAHTLTLSRIGCYSSPGD
jgi:hypothetical protein